MTTKIKLPLLETPRLQLRNYRYSDAVDLMDIVGSENCCRYVNFGPYWDLQALRQRMLLQHQLNYDCHDGYRWVIADVENNRPVGMINLKVPLDGATPSVGYMLKEELWGQGYMTEVLMCVLEFAFSVLGLPAVEAGHHTDNVGSCKVMEKVGLPFVCTESHPMRGDNVISHLHRLERSNWKNSLSNY